MKKILIIDYDQNSLASLNGIFAGQGYQVVTAADGQTGWDKYNKESPDLVLMEAMLPKVHGFELCQRITSERNSQATVFIMTGVYKDRVYRTEALRTYGASEYFEKPLKMAELLASVEAVLGRPEPRPAEAVRDISPEPAPPKPRKHERPKSDDSIFSLPDDLDRMSRETPKPHKPGPARRDPADEPRPDAMADQLLKTVIIEATAPKAVHAKPGNGNGNGNGNGSADIDQFLRSALADLDLNKEKVKVPKTAPLPPPPPPVEEKPIPTASRGAVPDLKPVPPAPPRSDRSFTPLPTSDMKNVLTPGDPGSDVSPFFSPEKPKPAERAERKIAAHPGPSRHEAPRREPVRHEPGKREPLPREEKSREARVIASTDIFGDVAEKKEKNGFSKLLLGGLIILALAAAGFFLLRPKHPAPVEAAPRESAQALNQAEEPAPKPAEEVPAPEVKPAPAKQKAQPQTKQAAPGPVAADAILPAGPPAAGLPLPGNLSGTGSGKDRVSSRTSPPVPDQAASRAEETALPAAKTEANPPPNAPAEPGTSSDPGGRTSVSAPAATPVNEGDLIELSAVTEPPRIIKSVDPVYPQTARRIGREGQITVNVLIDEKGNVIDTGILKGIQDDKGLGRAAETAIRKWKFQPARKDGVAVKVWKSFIIAFKADTNPADKME